MRTNTGTIEEVLPNGMVRIQTNRNSLYSPCSASLCADNVVIDAVNKIGAKKANMWNLRFPMNIWYRERCCVSDYRCFLFCCVPLPVPI